MIAVIGLGYVGLPLAVAFAHHWEVLGFDVNPTRVAELKAGHDRTLEVDDADLAIGWLRFTDNPQDLHQALVFIITVPTPIDAHKNPDLAPLKTASRMVGAALKPGDIVVYESTVYPGCTEEECVPILEVESRLSLNVDFTVGYSPERINPGETDRKLAAITKVVSGSSPEALENVASLYGAVIEAGIHKAPSIRVAEAAKVIENTQRDVNIALVNELAILFEKLGLKTEDVLAAASTKWNFLPFQPGLVGGHCIGVDPYYLTHKAQEVGHHPEVILAGRRINDGMGDYVADQVVLLMTRRGIAVGNSRVLVLGLAFKENCPDLRNTRVVDIMGRLRRYGIRVDVFDPWVDRAQAEQEYGLELLPRLPRTPHSYDAAVVAVPHREFVQAGALLRRVVGDQGVIYDVKGLLGAMADARL